MASARTLVPVESDGPEPDHAGFPAQPEAHPEQLAECDEVATTKARDRSEVRTSVRREPPERDDVCARTLEGWLFALDFPTSQRDEISSLGCCPDA